jgi:hypothetical protein
MKLLVRKWLPVVGAAFGLSMAVLGNVLYSLGPCGETGVLAGKGGICFWWIALPGQIAGAAFDVFGIKEPWSSILGGTVLWGVVGLLIAIIAGRRGAASRDS